MYTQDSKAYPGKTYISTVEIKYLEMAGAKVIPILYKSTQAELTNVLNQINGVLFPGGNTTININNSWTQNADFILKYAKEQN